MNTPKTNRVLRNIQLQDTPNLNVLGHGTGVRVYSLKRSPRGANTMSPWAIKRVNKQNANPLYEQRLKKEAEMLKNLNHPNIVGFRGFTKSDDGRDVLAMEDCNISLGDIIEERRESNGERFTVEQILHVIHDVAQALCYLHEEKHLLHCDIKSYNILIKGDFQIVKLCDFGSTAPLDSNGYLKEGCSYEGTELWMPPEYFNDDEDTKITSRADIFPLGLCIWEMLTLQIPFITNYDDQSFLSDSSFMDLSSIPYGTRPELPSDIPPAYKPVIDIFMQCTESDPEKRISAKQLVQYIKMNNLI